MSNHTESVFIVSLWYCPQNALDVSNAMYLKVAVLSRVDSCKQRGHVIVNNRHVTINRNVVILITYAMRMLYKNKVWGLWEGQHRPESRAVTMMDSGRPPDK